MTRPSRRHPVKRPSFRARRSTAMKPALCRVPSYSEPGLPRPTTTLGPLTLLASLFGLRGLFLLLLGDQLGFGLHHLFRGLHFLEYRRRHHRRDRAVHLGLDLGALGLDVAHVERVA